VHVRRLAAPSHIPRVHPWPEQGRSTISPVRSDTRSAIGDNGWTTAHGCGFNWSAQHMLGFRTQQQVLVESVLIASSAVSWSLSFVVERLRIVAKPRRRKALGFKRLSVRMDGVASTG